MTLSHLAEIDTVCNLLELLAVGFFTFSVVWLLLISPSTLQVHEVSRIRMSILKMTLSQLQACNVASWETLFFLESLNIWKMKPSGITVSFSSYCTDLLCCTIPNYLFSNLENLF